MWQTRFEEASCGPGRISIPSCFLPLGFPFRVVVAGHRRVRGNAAADQLELAQCQCTTHCVESTGGFFCVILHRPFFFTRILWKSGHKAWILLQWHYSHTRSCCFPDSSSALLGNLPAYTIRSYRGRTPHSFVDFV